MKIRLSNDMDGMTTFEHATNTNHGYEIPDDVWRKYERARKQFIKLSDELLKVVWQTSNEES